MEARVNGEQLSKSRGKRLRKVQRLNLCGKSQGLIWILSRVYRQVLNFKITLPSRQTTAKFDKITHI
jgi:hypothetical protein